MNQAPLPSSSVLPLWWKCWLLGPQDERERAALCLEQALCTPLSPKRHLVLNPSDRLAAFDGIASSIQFNQCDEGPEAPVRPPFEETSMRALINRACPQVAMVLGHQSQAVFKRNYITRSTKVWLWRPSAMTAWPAHPFLVGTTLTGITNISLDTPSVGFSDVVHKKETGAPEVQVEEGLVKMDRVCQILRTYLRAQQRSNHFANSLPDAQGEVAQGERL